MSLTIADFGYSPFDPFDERHAILQLLINRFGLSETLSYLKSLTGFPLPDQARIGLDADTEYVQHLLQKKAVTKPIRRRKKRKGQLESKIEHKYESRGISKKRADYIAKSVIGKISRNRKRKLVVEEEEEEHQRKKQKKGTRKRKVSFAEPVAKRHKAKSIQVKRKRSIENEPNAKRQKH